MTINPASWFKTSDKISWLEVLIYSLIPLGQLWVRIFKFNGSLDKWWLMFPLLQIPPFSFIPMLMMKFGFISNGKGTNPIDYAMILPIVAKFIIPFILPFMIGTDHKMLFTIVSFILQLLTIMIANLSRRYYGCNSITGDSIGKAGVDSVIALGFAEILPFIIPWVPIIGSIYNIVSLIPYIGNILGSFMWCIGFAGTYIVINMFNQYNMGSFCNTPFYGNNQDFIPFIISLIIIIGINLFSMFSLPSFKNLSKLKSSSLTKLSKIKPGSITNLPKLKPSSITNLSKLSIT